VYTPDGDPVAVLLPHGRLAGTNNTDAGEVGLNTAAFPGSAYAWLSIKQGSDVVRYDNDGNEQPDGTWAGCDGPMLRTCTLATHLVLLREWQRRPRMTVGVGMTMRF
jgi:hypothetical protein